MSGVDARAEAELELPEIADPILLEVVRNYLVSTCEEMGMAMMRTSYSTMFNEARDFSCVIFDARGEMVAQGDFCPAHIGAIVHTVEWAVKEVGPENMHPGDVILHNDPYRGGCHLPEFMTMKPCFRDGEIVAYAANIAHMTDIGGMVPAAFGDTRNIFQEGLRLPPVKIYRDDQPVEDIFAIITSNVRTPVVSRGDLMAMVGSTYLAERRILDLVEKHGIERFNELAAQMKDVSEVLMRRAIRRIPNGEYTAEGLLEDDGVIPDRPWKIRATLVVRDDEIIVDYTGSDEQAAGAINQSFGTTASATYASIFHMVDEDIPWNHGAYRPISIVAPPGSIVNVEYPGSCVGGNSDTYPTTVDILLSAFAQASDRSSAPDGGTCGLLGFYGNSVDTGQPFVILHHEGMGWGGRDDADGNDAQIVKNGNCLNAPCELWESRYPVRIEEYRIADGSPGPGRQRGGAGVQRIWRCLEPITVSAHLNHTRLPIWGLHGGKAGGNTALLFKRDGEDEWRTATDLFGTISDGKFSNVMLEAGDQILLRMPGGGGYGDPLDRDPHLVAEDLRDELIGREAAEAVYGVVIGVDLAPDASATARRREELRHAAS
jgi:N-methylhydantoinase B/oxoprolinase/acetone carboxylase alpha subunit